MVLLRSALADALGVAAHARRKPTPVCRVRNKGSSSSF